MRKPSAQSGFTLIELLTVIAIIAILMAILFPVAGTVREQARAGDCLSKLHQIYVSASVYKMDEGSFPPTLFGYAEVDNGVGGSTGLYYTGSGGVAPMNRVVSGYLYPEQTKDSLLYRCPDATLARSNTGVTVAHFAKNPPASWPSGLPWIGDSLAAYGCPTDSVGTIDCFVGGPNDKLPKYYYTQDSYDVGPLVDVNGNKVLAAPGGPPVYMVHYSTDWTGITGLSDMTNQLKYANPPADRTILTYCSWHAFTAGTKTTPAVSLSGSAKKLDLKNIIQLGPNIYNQ